MEIPQQVAERSDDGVIPDSVTQLPSDQESDETKPYVFSFEKYNKRLCEIESLHGNRSIKVLSTIKDVGMKLYTFEDFRNLKFTIQPIYNLGEYQKLFKGLDNDIELYEIKLTGSDRIFFFLIESVKTIYIVAIKGNHFEIGKNRR
ncbi:MAG: hypothetical protein KJ571_01575 [Bacteroidetes bacterium]|nr:hypothetical protein [Bacteroidota bacterium]